MTTKKCQFMEGTRYLARPNDDLPDDEPAIYWFTTASQPPYALDN